VVVAFDVRDDRRRTRLGRHLLRHGTRVQLSVFECLVRHHRIEAFMRELMRFLDPTVDRLTVYPLCHPCQDGVHRRGAPLGALPEPEAFIV
jgi:CRISPR-associated protein Cas2